LLRRQSKHYPLKRHFQESVIAYKEANPLVKNVPTARLIEELALDGIKFRAMEGAK